MPKPMIPVVLKLHLEVPGDMRVFHLQDTLEEVIAAFGGRIVKIEYPPIKKEKSSVIETPQG